MGEHTPGPWDALQADDAFIVAQTDQWGGFAGSRVVDIVVHGTPMDILSRPVTRAEAEANARLIAAAPELLAACESILSILSFLEHIGHVCMAERHIPELRAAVTKARALP